MSINSKKMGSPSTSQPPQPPQQQQHVWVVVLGDFGRSPRMQYHAQSLSLAGYEVDVVAMSGSPPIAALKQARNVHIHNIPQLPPWVAAKAPALLGLLLKAVFQLLSLLWMMLVVLPRPAAILMQNPPAIPSMLVCWLAALRHRAAWVIDWHNTAFSIMQLKYGRYPWLINLAGSIEQQLGRRAAAHFCVTKAFKQWLEGSFGLSGVLVLYDRPPAMFHRCSLAETHALLQRLQPALAADGIGSCMQQQLAAAVAATAGGASRSTLLTCEQAAASPAGGGIDWRPGRPALVVSSTSWTPDEDFGILLDAAEAYDAATAGRTNSSSTYPDVVFVITGRGPQRDMYLSKIKQLPLTRVAFCSMWLEPEDYPLILGAADLGVCLHTSSSGGVYTLDTTSSRSRSRALHADITACVHIADTARLLGVYSSPLLVELLPMLASPPDIRVSFLRRLLLALCFVTFLLS